MGSCSSENDKAGGPVNLTGPGLPPQDVIPQPVEVLNVEPALSTQLAPPPENLQTPNTFQNGGINPIENNIIPQENPSYLNPTSLTMKDGNMINTSTSLNHNQNIPLNNNINMNMNDQYNLGASNNVINNNQNNQNKNNYGIYQPKTPNDFMLGSKYKNGN